MSLSYNQSILVDCSQFKASISNYKSWAESTQEELNRFRYENKI